MVTLGSDTWITTDILSCKNGGTMQSSKPSVKDLETVERLKEANDKIANEIGKIIVGQKKCHCWITHFFVSSRTLFAYMRPRAGKNTSNQYPGESA